MRKFNQFQGDFRALINNYEARGGYGKSRLDPEVEQRIDTRIEEVLLRPKAGSHGCPPSCDALHSAVEHFAHRVRAPSKYLACAPSNGAFRNISAYDFALARYGRAEANRRFGMYLGARRVDRILQLVEIDHSPLDILVVDEDGVVIGRPSVTVIIDRQSLHFGVARFTGGTWNTSSV